MTKVGAYLPTHNNPMFARLAMLQLAAQTRRPDVIALYQNGSPNDYGWAVDDVSWELAESGVDILTEFSTDNPGHPNYQLRPLKRLYAEGCDVFFKIDHDDFYDTNHIESGLSGLRICDILLNESCRVLVLPYRGKYVYYPKMTFYKSPMKGHASSVCFSRDVAEEYIRDMEENQGKEDDLILGTITAPKFNIQRWVGQPTTTYVTHGANTDTSYWAESERLRQKGLGVSNGCPYPEVKPQ